jgi:DNA-binding transcriptional ArsR family regulator
MSISDEEFAILNAVYLRKMVTVEAMTAITGLDQVTVAAHAAALTERGLVADVGGGNFMLEQPEGVRAAIDAYDERYAELRDDDEVEAWYQRFESLNAQFLQAISAWQTSGEDEGVLDKLLRLVDRQIKALASFAATLPRYQRYAQRLAGALDKVESGDTGYVTSLSRDSIHNVWFELHEDILTVLGRPRDAAEADRS